MGVAHDCCTVGIVGSARVLGNSDLQARQALLGAQAEGATDELLRLTSLHIEPCTGCMRCVLGRRPCAIDDDMAWLIHTIQAANALVLVAPTYFLGPAAVLKLVLDRLLMVTAAGHFWPQSSLGYVLLPPAGAEYGATPAATEPSAFPVV